ncbi:hypothetical protein [Candidatus Nitrosacidococcus tergens]|uniref:Uncharacterized protein n=1 Tax=Candidatus Nitrosacidococcus tergens TaxID=553981 RepID=A0A7G1Q9K3_9GAMM|nr:hypothetical protein [Candidatus Nitrosacidococcus tergens]CAB1275491.1 conserved protein of unknown function [Candidatus Nitrosacidococcus tergens]
MNFVIVERNQKNVPNSTQLEAAMHVVGGSEIQIRGTDACRKVKYTGSVNHNN